MQQESLAKDKIMNINMMHHRRLLEEDGSLEAFCSTCFWESTMDITCDKRASYLASTYKMTENQAINSLLKQKRCIDPSYNASSAAIGEEESTFTTIVENTNINVSVISGTDNSAATTRLNEEAQTTIDMTVEDVSTKTSDAIPIYALLILLYFMRARMSRSMDKSLPQRPLQTIRGNSNSSGSSILASNDHDKGAVVSGL